MEAFSEFRARTVRYSLIVTGAATAGALFWNSTAALGLLIGGLAGIVAFHLLTRRVSEFVGMTSVEIQISAMRGMFQRLGVYAAALTAAHLLQPDTHVSLFAAAVGILIPRAVLYVLALKSSLGKQGEAPPGESQQ